MRRGCIHSINQPSFSPSGLEKFHGETLQGGGEKWNGRGRKGGRKEGRKEGVQR